MSVLAKGCYNKRMGIFSFIFGTTKNSDTSENAGDSSDSAENRFVDAQGRKVMPEIDFVDLDPILSSDKTKLELWATLHNTSDFAVEITRIELLGQSIDPDRHLKPGEKYKLRVYRGDTPKTDAYSRAKLAYKISANGDYFEQQFFVDYDYDDERYVPKSIESDRSVRDV